MGQENGSRQSGILSHPSTTAIGGPIRRRSHARRARVPDPPPHWLPEHFSAVRRSIPKSSDLFPHDRIQRDDDIMSASKSPGKRAELGRPVDIHAKGRRPLWSHVHEEPLRRQSSRTVAESPRAIFCKPATASSRKAGIQRSPDNTAGVGSRG